ncbi:DUF4148 domain-containing protein [Paraburkholderia sp. NMBU_R16]|uniref:DUF4148 domain-containing protein n=1 Tax=Paraburkholderia sp. NMBU_R16 TaxID=2698676 RepID=UPI0020B8A6C7|nr:DUF4148 domain-containing protein [Paraburkholderia sp. NMBU_R16]NRO98281.1 DUF4148 domain-containing protein [Paraburkholderia sp. NMBU_R16]
MKPSFRVASLRSALVAPMFALGAAVFALPAVAQSTDASHAQITRASVRAQLEELVGAGYNPRDWYHYPDNLQAAQRVVDQRHTTLAQSDAPVKAMSGDTSTNATSSDQSTESMGGVAAGKSDAGAPVDSAMDARRACAVGPQCSAFYGR